MQASVLVQDIRDRGGVARPRFRRIPCTVDYARHGVSTWRDFVATAALVRRTLGISPSAWEEACAVMGEEDACVLVAAILQKGAAIDTAGGYLRSLSERARAGQFSLGPVLMALLRTRTGEGRPCSKAAGGRT